MLSDEVKSLIHLNLMQNVGSRTVQQLVEIFDCAVEVLEALKASPENIQKELQKIGSNAPAGLVHEELHYALDRELKLIDQHNCTIVTLYDEEYPPLLKQIQTPPVLLYIKGELRPEDMQGICVVGTREASDYGQQVSRQLSSELANENVTVVSGLAIGIDVCAHRGALGVGGRTLAVMGRGLSDIYPAKHRKLAEEIVKSGALISEFPMDMGTKSGNFPQRNRTMSGLALGTVVVEAPSESGALITAREAFRQGRKVFAVPGQIFTRNSKGCHKLIKDGALLVETVGDLLGALSHYIPDIPDKQTNIEEPPEQEYLFDPPLLPSEVVVENAVVKYFNKTIFKKFSMKLQHEIQVFSHRGRADIVLVDAENDLVVIVECKRIGYIGTGVEQLQSYLSVTETRFGIFANSKQPDEWAFYERQGRNNFKQISRSEFEREVTSNITTKKS